MFVIINIFKTTLFKFELGTTAFLVIRSSRFNSQCEIFSHSLEICDVTAPPTPPHNAI